MRLLACTCIALLTAAAADRSAAGQTAAGPTFKVGTATATRGQTAYGAIEVPAGSDAALSIPAAVVHGARPGPESGVILYIRAVPSMTKGETIADIGVVAR